MGVDYCYLHALLLLPFNHFNRNTLFFTGASDLVATSGWPDRVLNLAAKLCLLFFSQLSWFKIGLSDNVEQAISVDKHRLAKYADIANHPKVLSVKRVTSMSTRSSILNL